MQAATNPVERHREEPTATGRDIQQELMLALALAEEPVIEGEVIAVIEPELQPAPKQRPYYLIVVGTILACLLFVGVTHVLPLLTPSAIVTIIPRQEHLATTGAIVIHGRMLPALTLAQSATVPATGKRHQDATRAQGTITLYNGLFTSQTIAAGTILTGADGAAVITDQPAVIPAGNPPVYGQVTVSAHALNKGEPGNIAAYDVNTVCCATSVLAKNTEAFAGGEDGRDFLVVTQADLNAARGEILPALEKSEQAALGAQITAGEALTPPLCSENVTSDHRMGEEARAVTVTLSDTCSGFVYDAHALNRFAVTMIQKDGAKRLGTGYGLLGAVTASVIHAAIIDQARGIAALTLKLDASFVYRLSQGVRKQIARLIAGKSTQQAVQALFELPGIQAASIRSSAATMPENEGAITIIVVTRSV